MSVENFDSGYRERLQILIDLDGFGELGPVPMPQARDSRATRATFGT